MKLYRLEAYTVVTGSSDVREDLALHAEGKRDDEEHEHSHLQHQKHKDLFPSASISLKLQWRPATGGTHESVVQRHRDGGAAQLRRSSCEVVL